MLEELSGLLQGDTLNSIASAVGADPASVTKGLSAAIPALIGALATQSKTPEGAAGMFDTISKNFDGNLLNNLGSLTSNPLVANGLPFLQGILGDSQGATEDKIAKASGLNAGIIGRLLPILAPIVLSYVGKMIKTNGMNATDLTGFMSDQQGFARAAAPGLLGWLENIDANDDGSVLDDLGRLAGRLFGKSGS
jgi:hypothetical protein